MILQNSHGPHESQDKELLDLDSVTWSVPSIDMNSVISSALTLTSYTTELPGRLGLRLKLPL